MRFGFLFNHDASHQIPHTLPVAAALAARGEAVEILASSPQQRDIAEAMLPPGPAPGPAIRITTLGIGKLAGAADRLLRHAVPFRRIETLRQNLAAFDRLDALIVPETTTTLLRSRFGKARPKLIYLPHGAGDGAAGFQSATRYFDLVLLSGRKVADRMLAAGLISPGGYAIIGYPKFDLVDFAAARPDPFGNGRLTVLYNPHFSPALSSWYRHGEAILEYFASQDRVNLIFAPHVMLFRRRVHISLIHRAIRLRPQVPQRFLDRRGMLPGMIIDTGSARSIDMSHALAADIYLGDVSSQIYEWIRVPRPAIFLDHRGANPASSPDYAFQALGQVIHAPKQLPAAIDRALSGPDPYAARQAQAAEETFSITGQPAGERAAEAILSFMRQAPPGA